MMDPRATGQTDDVQGGMGPSVCLLQKSIRSSLAFEEFKTKLFSEHHAGSLCTSSPPEQDQPQSCQWLEWVGARSSVYRA